MATGRVDWPGAAHWGTRGAPAFWKRFRGSTVYNTGLRGHNQAATAPALFMTMTVPMPLNTYVDVATETSRRTLRDAKLGMVFLFSLPACKTCQTGRRLMHIQSVYTMIQ